jgi:PBP1b-binding outer membrane lipoprotein LpoB
MKKIFLALSILSAFSYGCATTGVDPQKTQLQIREFQTRSYDTNDTKMVMKAMLNVLQDDGYIVKNANADLGLLTATKEVDVENKTTAIVASLFGGYNARWNKNSIIECSANVSEFGDQTRVRVNFVTKLMNNKGEVVEVRQIDDQSFYEQFFSKVDKGFFLQKEKLG